ncbi:MAG: oxidoreductase [Terriglobales bacterium]
MTNPLNVGLIGFGLAGQVFHAPLIHANPHLRLTHVVQRHGNEAGKKYPQAKLLHHADELFAEPSVDLVVVATPNASHFELGRKALQAGKHVVVDKPFTTISADADELIALSRQVGRVLSVFQNRRWDGDFLTVQQILNQKRVGRLVEYESRFDRFRPALKSGAWREQAIPGSGVLFDLGSHLIDQAVVLFGRPQGIYTDSRSQREGAVADDSFEVRLEYPALKVTLKAGSLVCEPSPRFVLYGTQGSYLKFGLDPQEEALKDGGLPTQPNWGEEPSAAWGTVTQCDGNRVRAKYPTLAGCYQEYYSNVSRAIAGKEELAVKPEEAIEVIRLIELAQKSALEKRTIPIS